MTAAVAPGGGYVVRVRGLDVVDVVPGWPQPEHPGTPDALRLWDFGEVAQLNLGVAWPVPEPWIRAQGPALLGEPRLTGTRTRVRVAVVGTPRVALRVTAAAGQPPAEVVAVDTSGYPPFVGLVSVPVHGATLAALRAAAAGERGRAFVTVSAALPDDLPLDLAVLSRTALVVQAAPDLDPSRPHPVRRPTPGLGATAVTATSDLADWASPTPSGSDT